MTCSDKPELCSTLIYVQSHCSTGSPWLLIDICRNSNSNHKLDNEYLGNEKFPNRMLSVQCSNTSNLESASGEEDATRDEEIPKNLNLRSYPFEVGGLQIRSLGNLACYELMSPESFYIEFVCFYVLHCS
ncbi:hypothetical protein POM88_050025 [Heracleum sosnowskyi]|uniref:Uncharacterized protein n=1 Tax=Heracleum sosnowskyi TaxID=360622 RepID=A0AAD8GY06_9APIA|nr:hypothetical protein POM88_050025 [Heracleum sosnowskyi]